MLLYRALILEEGGRAREALSYLNECQVREPRPGQAPTCMPCSHHDRQRGAERGLSVPLQRPRAAECAAPVDVEWCCAC